MKVSVIITTFSRSRLLCEAIDSVLGQDFQDFESIVVDGGSAEDTANTVSNDGDVTPSDLQSWYDKPMIWSEVFEETSRLTDMLIGDPPVDPKVSAYIGRLYDRSLEHYFVLPSTAMFRRSLIAEPEPFPVDDPICGDWDFCAPISKQRPLCFVDYDIAYNRSHFDDVRLTQTLRRQQLDLQIRFVERTYMSDVSFYSTNKVRVDAVWRRRLMEDLKLQLMDSNSVSARETATRVPSADCSLTFLEQILTGATYIPGSGFALSCARALKRRLEPSSHRGGQ